jgi:hypothetical protein
MALASPSGSVFTGSYSSSTVNVVFDRFLVIVFVSLWQHFHRVVLLIADIS